MLILLKALLLLAALVATAGTILMWAAWLFGRTGPRKDEKYRMCERWSVVTAGLWLSFIVLAFS